MRQTHNIAVFNESIPTVFKKWLMPLLMTLIFVSIGSVPQSAPAGNLHTNKKLSVIAKELSLIPTQHNQPDFFPLFENETENESVGKKEPNKIGGFCCVGGATPVSKVLLSYRAVNFIATIPVKSDKAFIRLRVLKI